MWLHGMLFDSRLAAFRGKACGGTASPPRANIPWDENGKRPVVSDAFLGVRTCLPAGEPVRFTSCGELDFATHAVEKLSST